MPMDPVEKIVVVPAPPEKAFRRFTEEVDTWWPRRSHSVFQEGCAEVRMEGRLEGRLYEISDDGEESTWGRVTAWDPPRTVAFTWHPGRDEETAQSVEVTFRPVERGTRVRIEHVGWEKLGEAAEETRNGYDRGWEVVLERYRGSLGEA